MLRKSATASILTKLSQESLGPRYKTVSDLKFSILHLGELIEQVEGAYIKSLQTLANLLSQPTRTPEKLREVTMSNPSKKKTSPWFYVALVVQTLFIILGIGMLKDLMWIL